ncbi:MAG TPA: hypothetical protein EYH42_08875, partial [Sulfurovum sp.]|nr:hypothetical protein [Sulfurovum sp.]
MQKLLKLFIFFIFFLITPLHALTVTKTYPGPTVTVDGTANYAVNLPAVNFSAADFYTGATITQVTISITWLKTDGSCTSPSTGFAYHNETNFRINGPTGNERLIRPNTYSGGVNIGNVTTLFDQTVATNPSGTPSSGTFNPNNGNLNNYIGDNPVGNWNLSAGDNAGADPLCVHSYTVNITVPDPLPALSLVKSVDDNTLVVAGQTLT